MIKHYSPSDLTDYISWTYFFHAWNLPHSASAVAELHDCPACRTAWLNSFPEEEREQARVAAELFDDARKTLDNLGDAQVKVHALCRVEPAWSEGDDIIVEGIRLPMLRQQSVTDGPCLCLADFVRPQESSVPTTTPEGKPTVGGNIGLFATAVDRTAENISGDDPYKRMLTQTVLDRLAEAAAERLHETVRRTTWGYVPDEKISRADMLRGNYQGIRPAVGYPSLPDQSIIFQLDQILDLGSIGISLTESGAMLPHASVCGLMFAHPEARYFAVGKISEEQFADYASRRQLPPERLRTFLARVL